MKWLQDHEVAINLALFKRYQFYQIFNPNGSKLLNYDTYKLTNVMFIVAVTTYNIFSAMCFFTDTIDTIDSVDLLLMIFIYSIIIISLLKISVLLFNADQIWELFDLTRFDFLTSRQCRKNVGILCKYRDRSITITNLYQNYSTMVFIIWMITPLVLNTFVVVGGPNQRYHNIFNMQYPVSANIYNQYYYLFYLMEIAMGIFVLNYSMIVDNFLISLCWVIIAQYEVITTAFEKIGNDCELTTLQNEKNNNSFEAYEDLKSILMDQNKLYIKLKSFYRVVWIIVIFLIIIDSVLLIILTYSFVMICSSAESFSIFNILKISTAFFVFVIQLYLYCYLFDVLNDKKESVNFGLYCCDWTKMDLRFKKLLLLATKFNNANTLKIKSTPNKIVNLQLFSSVMTTAFNIVTVMLKTMNGKN
uniref:Odorant receptor n=1 Tax=Acyrthosiphon pisum TaxID=7029 RepID=A0A1S6J156_ACYPI|nr:olfactory receptor 37 protein [Acyrthosiphon pisum]